MLLALAVTCALALPGAASRAAPVGSAGATWSAGSSGPTASLDATAQAGPQRAGRLSDFQGRVWLFDTEMGQWVEALRNRALTEGDRLSTERGAQAEVRVGSTELRLGASTELEIVRMDEGRMSFQVHRGSLALRVRSREIAEELELLTAEARLQPGRAGAYRVDREDDTTWVTSWRGALQVHTPDQAFDLPAGQRVELALQGGGRSTFVSWSAPVQDRFAEWVQSDEQRDDRSASLHYVSPEMTGAEDLDRHGRWERHPEFGMVWAPLVVATGWAPFKHGRWIWHARWGWTWVDLAPWGFAPFHYGRWVLWGHRWVWTPGPRMARPVFAPALVTFTSPSVGVSVVIGPSRPPVAWVPLAPREPYRPWTGHRPHPMGPPHPPHVWEPGHRAAPRALDPGPRGAGAVVLPERRPVPGFRPPLEPRPAARLAAGGLQREGAHRPYPFERAEKDSPDREQRGERGIRVDHSERGERSGKPEPTDGHRRFATQHRPRDQRERAQMQ